MDDILNVGIQNWLRHLSEGWDTSNLLIQAVWLHFLSGIDTLMIFDKPLSFNKGGLASSLVSIDLIFF
jgi:hypothetical protein